VPDARDGSPRNDCRQRRALERANSLVNAEALLSDWAWR
jgi:hypothetical protein